MAKIFNVGRKSHHLTDLSFKRKQMFVTRVRIHGFDSLRVRHLVTASFTHAKTFDCYVHSTVPRKPLFHFSYPVLASHVIYS